MHRPAAARYPSAVAVRLLALLVAATPPVLGLLGVGAKEHAWIPAVAAVALALPVLVLRKRAASLIVLGVGMAALASVLTLQSRDLFATTQGEDDWPTHDLTQAPFPDSTSSFVRVRGFFRDEWTLDEYGTPHGERPDLNTPARAVLVPFVGSLDPTLKLEGRIVIARVPSGKQKTEGVLTIRGKLEPAHPDILATLVQLDPTAPADAARGVVLDTLHVPDPQDRWTRSGLAILCTIIALGCMWVAGAPSPRRHI
jgi:hypothetical protein